MSRKDCRPVGLGVLPHPPVEIVEPALGPELQRLRRRAGGGGGRHCSRTAPGAELECVAGGLFVCRNAGAGWLKRSGKGDWRGFRFGLGACRGCLVGPASHAGSSRHGAAPGHAGSLVVLCAAGSGGERVPALPVSESTVFEVV